MATALVKRRSAAQSSAVESVDRIEHGLPVVAVRSLGTLLGLDEPAILMLAKISRSSFKRRQKSGRLSPEESDRVFRLSRITRRTIDFFEGDAAAAHHWLQRPAPALAGKRPLDLIINDAGVGVVENLLLRLEHGVFT